MTQNERYDLEDILVNLLKGYISVELAMKQIEERWDKSKEKQPMSGDLTICAKCRHYSASFSVYAGLTAIRAPAWCWYHDDKQTSAVTGEWTGPVSCEAKNDGHCPDYEYKEKDPGKVTIIEAPKCKHWWQK